MHPRVLRGEKWAEKALNVRQIWDIFLAESVFSC